MASVTITTTYNVQRKPIAVDGYRLPSNEAVIVSDYFPGKGFPHGAPVTATPKSPG
jgi:hypothetical protein